MIVALPLTVCPASLLVYHSLVKRFQHEKKVFAGPLAFDVTSPALIALCDESSILKKPKLSGDPNIPCAGPFSKAKNVGPIWYESLQTLEFCMELLEAASIHVR
ncbi:hypothetical protein OIU74_004687 [Salix koriyanagi]|uniref:Uncharacterized protein n=1 Tax=Salix koriyanagi TaxID=2511006 RepID=A0A9Q0UMC3_9ROSI|nr:hypothetical protein OIU74_004687 [Salix koriyanagi]